MRILRTSTQQIGASCVILLAAQVALGIELDISSTGMVLFTNLAAITMEGERLYCTPAN